MNDQDTGTARPGQVQFTADLLRSLQETIHFLRNDAEDLRRQIRMEADEDCPAVKSQVAKLDPLIRDCQKVEKLLAEQSADFARLHAGHHELDLAAARREVDGRLARLHAAFEAAKLPG